MGPPVKRLSPELVREHPALQEFIDYIHRHQGTTVDPKDIVVSHGEGKSRDANGNLKKDHFLDFNYTQAGCTEGERCNGYSARMSATHQSIMMRHGWGTWHNTYGLIPATDTEGNPLQQNPMNGQPTLVWVDRPQPHLIGGTCTTLHEIGGSMDAGLTQAVCSDLDTGGKNMFAMKAHWLGAFALSSLLGTDTIVSGFRLLRYEGLKFWRYPGALDKTYPMTRSIIRGLTPVGNSYELPYATLGTRMKQITPGLLAGGTAMAGAHLFGEVIGMDANYHRNERFQMGALAGYSANWWVTAGKVNVNAMKLSSGLITAALVDATIGSAFEEGSAEREALKGASFFIPQVYQAAMGNRSLGFTQKPVYRSKPQSVGADGKPRKPVRKIVGYKPKPKVATAGQWLGRAFLTGFLADLGYSGFNFVSEGSVDSAREHREYRLAQEIREENEGWSLWRGVLGLMAPSLVERYTVSDKYLKQAQGELSAQAKQSTDGVTSFLRHQIIHGDGGANREKSFYTKVDLGFLKGENNLGDDLGVFQRADGKRLPLKLMAQQIQDPKVAAQYLEGKAGQEQLEYLQKEFSGWDLNALAVQESLGRINLHQIRSQLGQVHLLTQEDPYTNFFDESGNLIPGQEEALVAHVYQSLKPGSQEVDWTRSILEARKVALVHRILQLREYPEMNGDLEAYTQIAQELGLMDRDGNLSPGELVTLARRIPIHKDSLNPHPENPGYDRDKLFQYMNAEDPLLQELLPG